MKHKVKKSGFGKGKDINENLLRKLTVNFLLRGTMVTTITRAKALKTHIDELAGSVAIGTNAQRNVLLTKIGSAALVDRMITHITPHTKKRSGGFVRIQKLLSRKTDGAPMARITWTDPVVLDESHSKTKKSSSEKGAQDEKKPEQTEKKKKTSQSKKKDDNSKEK